MRRAAFALLILLGAACAEPVTGNYPGNQRWENVCEEDQPCWDCHTMGNRICGPEIPGGLTKSEYLAEQFGWIRDF